MILFFSFWLAIFNPVFAGGQDGNGGNGCWFRNLGVVLSFEEMHYQQLRQEYHLPKLKLPSARRTALDLEGKMLSAVAAKLATLGAVYPLLSRTLLDALQVYSDVYVFSGHPLAGAFSGSFSAKESCRMSGGTFRPAILTFPNGGVVLLQSSWNQASSTTQQILLIHETVRFLQMFHPAIQSLTDYELELLAARVYEGKKLKCRHLLVRLEKQLRNFNARIPMEVKPLPGLAGTVTKTVHDYLLQGKTMGQALNHLRKGDPLFSGELHRQVKEIFSSWASDE